MLGSQAVLCCWRGRDLALYQSILGKALESRSSQVQPVWSLSWGALLTDLRVTTVKVIKLFLVSEL